MNQYSNDENLDELRYAIRHNGGDVAEDNIDKLLAVIEGENDGYNWHWIISLKDGRYAYLTGGCDYTGWDCQSSLSHEIFDIIESAIAAVPEIDSDERNSRELMRQQIMEEKANDK